MKGLSIQAFGDIGVCIHFSFLQQETRMAIWHLKGVAFLPDNKSY